jgi:hypothetical protein
VTYNALGHTLALPQCVTVKGIYSIGLRSLKIMIILTERRLVSMRDTFNEPLKLKAAIFVP